MRKGRRGDHLWRNGLWSGWGEYRHHASSAPPVTLAGPKTEAGSKKPLPILRGQKRRHVINKAIDVLRDWRKSPFEHEGAVRAGIRSALCLCGHGWHRSDEQAAEIVAAALHAIGAVRPTWEQGQREYVEPRENCARCAVELPDEMRNVGARFCSEECARFAIEYRDFEIRSMSDAMYKAAQDVIMRSKHHTRNCVRCNNPYRPLFGQSRFCSKECADLAAVVLPAIDCGNCGRTFKPKNRYIAYCSRTCAAEARVVAPERACETCGKSFRRAIGNSAGRGKYCSRQCAVAARSVVHLHKVCACCGAHFTAKGSKAKFCSMRCAQLANTFAHGRPPKRIAPLVLDYLFRTQGLRITGEVRVAA